MEEKDKILALDALRAASLWFTQVALDDDCAFMNGDMYKDKLSADERARPIRIKIDAAIEALTPHQGEPE